MFNCILCRRPYPTLIILANHVRDSHGKVARKSYKEGKWKIMSDNKPSLFDAIDGQKEAAVIQAAVDTGGSGGTPDVASQRLGEQDVPQQPSFIEPKADLIIGATGSGKTENIGAVADYIFLKYGKLTRLASTDPSGPGPLAGKVKAGKIDFWAPHAWPRPIEAMFKSTKGYWPLRADDPESPLVPPDAGTYEVYGFGAYEGLTSYGDTVLDDLKKNNVSLSQDPSYKWDQGDFHVSGGNMSYYGMMQDTLKLWVVNTHLLRYEKVLWTALEAKGKDQFGNVIAGPMIGGKQATGKAGQWFVNYVHIDLVQGKETLDVKSGQKLFEVNHILFLKAHLDPLSMVPFPCKIRAPKAFAKEVPAYLESGDLAEAYKLLDALYEKQMVQATAEMDEVKGLRERLMERAGKAKIAEAVAMEKRAKAANLLKPMVSVPALPTSPIGAATTVAGKPAGSAGLPAGSAPAPAKQAAMPAGMSKVPTATVPLGIPSIQNVRKGSK
jgi:hypothetical protein